MNNPYIADGIREPQLRSNSVTRNYHGIYCIWQYVYYGPLSYAFWKFLGQLRKLPHHENKKIEIPPCLCITIDVINRQWANIICRGSKIGGRSYLHEDNVLFNYFTCIRLVISIA